jgi:hypothetical protein
MLVIVAMDAAMGMSIQRVDNQLAKRQENPVKPSEKSFNGREPVKEMLEKRQVPQSVENPNSRIKGQDENQDIKQENENNNKVKETPESKVKKNAVKKNTDDTISGDIENKSGPIGLPDNFNTPNSEAGDAVSSLIDNLSHSLPNQKQPSNPKVLKEDQEKDKEQVMSQDNDSMPISTPPEELKLVAEKLTLEETNNNSRAEGLIDSYYLKKSL